MTVRKLTDHSSSVCCHPTFDMDKETEDPKKTVRVYSWQAEDRFAPESDARRLGRVLTDQEPSLEDILQPWRRFYEPWEPPDDER